MLKNNKFFDDMAKLATGATGNLLELKREIEEMISAQLEKMLQKMNLSTKQEHETLLAMVAKLRKEQEELKKRVDELEKSPKTPKKTVKKA